MTEGGSFCLSPDASSPQETGPRVLGARGRSLVCGRSWPCSVHGGGQQGPGAARLGKAASPPALKSLGPAGGPPPRALFLRRQIQARGRSPNNRPISGHWAGSGNGAAPGVESAPRTRRTLGSIILPGTGSCWPWSGRARTTSAEGHPSSRPW